MELIFFILCSSFLLVHSKVSCYKPFNSQLYRNDKFPNLFVWLTINAEVKLFDNPFKAIVLSQRLLELNWIFKDDSISHSDWIGLFDKVPNSNEDLIREQALYSITTNQANEGKIVTSIKYPVLDFNQSSALIRGCLGYFIGYVRSKKLLASNCLAAHSTWMADIQHLIKKVPIHDLMLPGTHNSGAYSLGYLQTNIAKRKINDYTLCQDETVFNQLVYGIRYLDLRIAYKGDNQFVITHDKFHINHKLDDILDQIVQFIELSPGEVVIVDFHRFPSGFPQNQPKKLKEIHKKMFDLVKKKLGKHIFPSVNQRYLVKFGELIDKNKRIMIGHANWFALDNEDRKLVFPQAIHIWKDENETLDKLLNFLKMKICTSHRNELEAASVFLTPTAKNVILNKYKSLRALSTKVNRRLTEEFRDTHWLNCSNVILTDFFLGNNFIELAIESNSRRFH